MSELVTISLKVPSELRDRLKDQATSEGVTTSALVLRAVQVMLEPRDDTHIVGLDDLKAKLAEMTADRDQWRNRAKAIVSAAGQPVTSNAEGRRVARQQERKHGNPVLASAVPEVPGVVPWCGLKGLK